MAFNGLTAEHQDQIKKFLKFFRSKRELHLKSIGAHFEDARTDRLTEDMYNQDDVVAIFETLEDLVKEDVRSELMNTINMTAILMRQLFEEADSQDIALEMDTATVEDQRLLEEVEKMRLDTPSVGGKKGGKLTSIRDEHQKIMEENEDLKKQVKELTAKFRGLQVQCTQILQEKSTVQKENAELREALADSDNSRALNEINDTSTDAESKGGVNRDESKGGSSMAMAEAKDVTGPNVDFKGLPDPSDFESGSDAQRIAILRRKVAELSIQLEEDDPSNRSKQMQQMRSIIGTKNEKLKELRQQLLKYEPDTCYEED